MTSIRGISVNIGVKNNRNLTAIGPWPGFQQGINIPLADQKIQASRLILPNAFVKNIIPLRSPPATRGLRDADEPGVWSTIFSGSVCTGTRCDELSRFRTQS
ncbi:hypothetical protein [Hafnia psychrotolerans]|uniref:Uncharacterized protein n=1 Tax=Hafnia psychrotolerans TaxID=1477018 RepID=A0ABQ1G0D2_9GAMM|nr:hypothetical protein [Hafnia psychrotolerans]GGA34439.1 hypothetical protein GCM10011328_06450 [Hafnia psychrotolerans]